MNRSFEELIADLLLLFVATGILGVLFLRLFQGLDALER